jgi:hypothetical protein
MIVFDGEKKVERARMRKRRKRGEVGIKTQKWKRQKWKKKRRRKRRERRKDWRDFFFFVVVVTVVDDVVVKTLGKLKGVQRKVERYDQE